MNLPDNFKFRFGDMPKCLHQADKDDEGVYHITWNSSYVECHGVSWYTCSKEEIQGFIAETDGWMIEG